MFKCRITHVETLFQTSQASAIIPQLPHVPAWLTYGQIHFAFFKYQIYKIHKMPLPLSLPVI
jgi:hypothetical protein